MDQDDLKSEILKIGEALTLCPHRCSGVRNEPEKGIVLRGLIFEKEMVTAVASWSSDSIPGSQSNGGMNTD